LVLTVASAYWASAGFFLVVVVGAGQQLFKGLLAVVAAEGVAALLRQLWLQGRTQWLLARAV
jgi:hypothetical protein